MAKAGRSRYVRFEHDPEKWVPAFGKDHAQRVHDPEKAMNDLFDSAVRPSAAKMVA
jgi:hypothetical protein